ncbi:MULTISPECIES: hypothetical protein [unclassified Acidovorax]|jgi:uncharacterized membrane protein HdeD (DUF308 family)|uniref:hypothetical protein n=1 Tax=unclassified Acidovorax TaxID=2684926 RepID=UPI0004648369|nr:MULTISPECIES: hypothetical protein [unclassified Acidovorax]MCL5740260.1 hypothetical protein [Betaproteobacteria bacterium]HQS21302.1 hypothetical protein [Acidovorax defluvii]MBP7440939.1 hypothetical protein [Acidovorax sp.]OYY27948.1 MAG: hypothetical protein B7Y64_09950 [Acidovorax sp. 35-64-16]OYZ46048.1 MAG: hypothetical protein B7Y20_04495 [Acidovorax sp. 16-64-162]
MPSPANRPASPANKADKELLFKGVTCALIGLVVLIAPYVARSPSVQDIMAQSALVGWFALVLGGGFMVRYAMRRAAATKARNQS